MRHLWLTHQENCGKHAQNRKLKLTRPFLACEGAGPRDWGGRGGADDDSWLIHTCDTESISIPPTLQLSRPDKSQSQPKSNLNSLVPRFPIKPHQTDYTWKMIDNHTINKT